MIFCQYEKTVGQRMFSASLPEIAEKAEFLYSACDSGTHPLKSHFSNMKKPLDYENRRGLNCKFLCHHSILKLE